MGYTLRDQVMKSNVMVALPVSFIINICIWRKRQRQRSNLNKYIAIFSIIKSAMCFIINVIQYFDEIDTRVDQFINAALTTANSLSKKARPMLLENVTVLTRYFYNDKGPIKLKNNWKFSFLISRANSVSHVTYINMLP